MAVPMFEAVILAGGFGTRLKEVSGGLPKPMVDVGGRPFLYRLMQRLEHFGCRRIILSLGYRADYVIKSIERDVPVRCEVDYVVEKEEMGTGGAIKLSAASVKSDKFVVLNGDSFSDIDYSDFFAASEKADLLISGVFVPDVTRYGTLDIDDDGRVEHLVEKGRSGSGIINSGIYVVRTPDMLSFAKKIFSFEQDFVQNFDGSFYAYITDGYFVDIGIPDDYYAACEKFA